MVFWLWGGVQKTLKKRKNQTEKKHWIVKKKKNEECKESQITTLCIFIGFKLYYARKHSFKKSCLYPSTIKFYLQFLCVEGYLKHINNTLKLNIHKYTNYNITEICINRLSTTTQIFMTMDYSIMMSGKYFHFRKRQKHLAKTFFSHPVEVTGPMNFGNIFRIICSSGFSKICTKTWKKLKKLWLYQSWQFSKICKFRSFAAFCTNKNSKQWFIYFGERW